MSGAAPPIVVRLFEPITLLFLTVQCHNSAPRFPRLVASCVEIQLRLPLGWAGCRRRTAKPCSSSAVPVQTATTPSEHGVLAKLTDNRLETTAAAHIGPQPVPAVPVMSAAWTTRAAKAWVKPAQQKDAPAA